MTIYDISQEIFSCEVYPGDPAPQAESVSRIKEGAAYNLSAFSMCAHNGTHVDAPWHFLDEGATVEQLPLEAMVGYAYVAEHHGAVEAEDAREMVRRAAEAGAHKGDHIDCHKRILIKGDAVVTEAAAESFAAAGILLIGNESSSIGPEDAPMAVHKILLSQGVVLLEGIRLAAVPEGVYFLSAAPINLAGFDGAPCRAVLVEM